MRKYLEFTKFYLVRDNECVPHIMGHYLIKQYESLNVIAM